MLSFIFESWKCLCKIVIKYEKIWLSFMCTKSSKVIELNYKNARKNMNLSKIYVLEKVMKHG